MVLNVGLSVFLLFIVSVGNRNSVVVCNDGVLMCSVFRMVIVLCVCDFSGLLVSVMLFVVFVVRYLIVWVICFVVDLVFLVGCLVLFFMMCFVCVLFVG